MTRVERLTELALKMHEGQVDKQGKPYSEHILAVAGAVSDEAKPVALFHDAVEDGPERHATYRTLADPRRNGGDDMTTHNGTEDQLTLDVGLHSALDVRDALITGALTIGGQFHCGVDLNAGDEITVTVATADGTVIAQGLATRGYPVFREIVDRGDIIGTERCNKAKVA